MLFRIRPVLCCIRTLLSLLVFSAALSACARQPLHGAGGSPQSIATGFQNQWNRPAVEEAQLYRVIGHSLWRGDCKRDLPLRPENCTLNLSGVSLPAFESALRAPSQARLEQTIARLAETSARLADVEGRIARSPQDRDLPAYREQLLSELKNETDARDSTVTFLASVDDTIEKLRDSFVTEIFRGDYKNLFPRNREIVRRFEQTFDQLEPLPLVPDTVLGSVRWRLVSLDATKAHAEQLCTRAQSRIPDLLELLGAYLLEYTPIGAATARGLALPDGVPSEDSFWVVKADEERRLFISGSRAWSGTWGLAQLPKSTKAVLCASPASTEGALPAPLEAAVEGLSWRLLARDIIGYDASDTPRPPYAFTDGLPPVFGAEGVYVRLPSVPTNRTQAAPRVLLGNNQQASLPPEAGGIAFGSLPTYPPFFLPSSTIGIPRAPSPIMPGCKHRFGPGWRLPTLPELTSALPALASFPQLRVETQGGLLTSTPAAPHPDRPWDLAAAIVKATPLADGTLAPDGRTFSGALGLSYSAYCVKKD